MLPTLEEIRRAPKVLLHDHLDGGLRPDTIVELAEETGYADLPTLDPEELGAWMMRGADRKDLLLYLETFAHTVGVMQTREALARVARHGRAGARPERSGRTDPTATRLRSRLPLRCLPEARAAGLALSTMVSSTSSSDAAKAVRTSSLNQADLPSSAWKVPNR